MYLFEKLDSTNDFTPSKIIVISIVVQLFFWSTFFASATIVARFRTQAKPRDVALIAQAVMGLCNTSASFLVGLLTIFFTCDSG